MSRFRQFGTFAKVEDQPDGTIMVYGAASSGNRDLAGEVVTPEAMKAALPDYSRFPALREMHEASAAGRVTEADVDGDGITNIVAHVVDPVAVTKVKAGVYAGFSIGGKVLKRDSADKSVITALRLVEISLVDSPCNPDAALSMWKADMSNYNPTGEEVVTKAKAMAEEAGSKRYKDFLYPAREHLIAKALEAELVDEAEEAADLSEGGTEAEKAAEIDTPASEVAAEAADQIDPVVALTAAIGKAADAVADAPSTDSIDVADIQKELDVVIAGLPGAEQVLAPLAKGMYSVSYLADVLSSLRSLLSMVTNYGEGASGDSQVPADIATAIRDLGSTLVTLAQEEVAVLLTSAGTLLPDIEIVELAALVDMTKANDAVMAKAGARNSKADGERIQTSHDHMAALGAKCDKGNCGDDDAEKVVSLAAENARLTKALTEAAPQVEEITKRFTDEVGTLKSTIEGLTKRLEQVESEPAAPKTAGSVRAITKAQDVSPATTAETGTITAEDFKKQLDALPETERGEVLLRIALKNPAIVQASRAAS